MTEVGSPDDLANFGKETDLTLPPVKTIEQGPATSVLPAASPDVEGVTGRYYEDCAEAPVVHERGAALAASRLTHLTRTMPTASGRYPTS
jgi:hypothetical protein